MSRAGHVEKSLDAARTSACATGARITKADVRLFIAAHRDQTATATLLSNMKGLENGFARADDGAGARLKWADLYGLDNIFPDCDL
jgi:hypothetical protein